MAATNLANTQRDMCLVSQAFARAEIGRPWSCAEYYLLFEIARIVREFLDESYPDNGHIVKLTDDSMYLVINHRDIDADLFPPANRAKIMANAADKLSKVSVREIYYVGSALKSASFINIFSTVIYRGEAANDGLLVKVNTDGLPYLSPYADYYEISRKLVDNVKSGNTLRMYQVLCDIQHSGNMVITVAEFRRRMGLVQRDSVKSWDKLREKIINPALKAINDTDTSTKWDFRKVYGRDLLHFSCTRRVKKSPTLASNPSLNEKIDATTRNITKSQHRYIETLVANCAKVTQDDPKKRLTNLVEIREWIITDVIRQQEKQGDDFNWRRTMNIISKQLRDGVYRQPHAHKYHASEFTPTDEDYNEAKKLFNSGEYKAISNRYSTKALHAMRLGYIADAITDNS